MVFTIRISEADVKLCKPFRTNRDGLDYRLKFEVGAIYSVLADVLVAPIKYEILKITC